MRLFGSNILADSSKFSKKLHQPNTPYLSSIKKSLQLDKTAGLVSINLTRCSKYSFHIKNGFSWNPRGNICYSVYTVFW